MFRPLGSVVTRFWPLMLVGWIAVLVAFHLTAPPFEEIALDRSFEYLPEEMPSRQGERLFAQAFSSELVTSNVVIVARRGSSGEGLLPRDRYFIEEVLKPRLEAIDVERNLLEVTEDRESKTEDRDPQTSTRDARGQSTPESVVVRVRTLEDPGIGELLVSDDGAATLIIVELRTEYLEGRNREVIRRIEELISREGPLRRSHLESELVPPPLPAIIGGAGHTAAVETARIPDGLDLQLSGSATVGRDMRRAAARSGDRVEVVSILLVVLLLAIIYRAPVPVIVPLATVWLSFEIAIRFLSILALSPPPAILAPLAELRFLVFGTPVDQPFLEMFDSAKIYIRVVLFGAGVDYCIFLIARYKEELDRGEALDESLKTAIVRVGSAVGASAGTTMFGIAMLGLASFGKVQQAGIAMSMSLVFVLAAALTFAPALLRLFGRWAFWPQVRSERISRAGGWLSPTSLLSRLLREGALHGVWEAIGHKLLRRPGTIWLTCVAVMAPFAVVAILLYDHLSYGLLSELPPDEPSVVGTRAVQEHFPAGITGPVNVLVKNTGLDFTRSAGEEAGEDAVRRLTDRLIEHKDELGIADVRSVVEPFGVTAAADRAERRFQTLNVTERVQRRNKVLQQYVSSQGDLAKHVTRLDVVFEDDPFSRHMIDRFERLKRTIRRELPAELDRGTELYFIGPTSSIRDLKVVTDRDQRVINIAVVLAVFAILVILLRRLAIPAYLIVSVFFSYLVTLGITFAVFWALDPAGFAGLDWKVPLFLFTILIAVGEDYNIYLITRIEEEQSEHGPVQGVTVALEKTGAIISSCGLIMAGAFASMIVSTLSGMQQLGFALAFGVLLDTFVVRPILVPAYLILLHSGRFGALGKWLGAQELLPQKMATERIERS